MRNRIFVLVAVGVLAVSGAAIAAAQTAAPEAAPAPAPGQKLRAPHPPGKPGARMGGPKIGRGVEHAIHGELIVPLRPAKDAAADAKRTFETITFDRGTVVSASDDALTIERPDGQRVNLTLNGDTKFRGVNKGSDLAPGTSVFAVSKEGIARQVGQPKTHRMGDKAGGPKPA